MTLDSSYNIQIAHRHIAIAAILLSPGHILGYAIHIATKQQLSDKIVQRHLVVMIVHKQQTEYFVLLCITEQKIFFKAQMA